eukprot:7864150-Lingulodinium_polyedra.AAC.1
MAHSDWESATCGVCGAPTETRSQPLCNLCDTLRDISRILADCRFTHAERQAALWSAAGLHRSLLAYVQSRASVPLRS